MTTTIKAIDKLFAELESKSGGELKRLAAALKIDGRSKLKKTELLTAIGVELESRRKALADKSAGPVKARPKFTESDLPAVIESELARHGAPAIEDVVGKRFLTKANLVHVITAVYKEEGAAEVTLRTVSLETGRRFTVAGTKANKALVKSVLKRVREYPEMVGTPDPEQGGEN